MDDYKTKLEQIRKDLDEIKSWLEYHDMMTRIYRETVVNYARRNNLKLTPELTKFLEDECIIRSSKEGEPYDEIPGNVYGCGYITFKHHIVKYVFDHYYDEFDKKREELENDKDGE
jgi:hypothetical protein